MNKKLSKLIEFLRRPVPVVFELWMFPPVFLMVAAQIKSLLTGQPIWTQIIITIFCLTGSIWWILYMHDRHGYKKTLDEMDFQRKKTKLKQNENSG